MSVATLALAQSMGLSEPELMNRALAAYLQEQRRAVLQARLELLARYGATNVTELEAKIEAAMVPEHPAWEDLIVAENLDARLEELDAYLRCDLSPRQRTAQSVARHRHLPQTLPQRQ